MYSQQCNNIHYNNDPPLPSLIQYSHPDTLVSTSPAPPYSPGLAGSAPSSVLAWRRVEADAVIDNPAASRPLPYNRSHGRSQSCRTRRSHSGSRKLPVVDLTTPPRANSPTPAVPDVPTLKVAPQIRPTQAAGDGPYLPRELRAPSRSWLALAIGLDNAIEGHIYTQAEIRVACALEDNWHKTRAQYLMVDLDDPMCVDARRMNVLTELAICLEHLATCGEAHEMLMADGALQTAEERTEILRQGALRNAERLGLKEFIADEDLPKQKAIWLKAEKKRLRASTKDLNALLCYTPGKPLNAIQALTLGAVVVEPTPIAPPTDLLAYMAPPSVGTELAEAHPYTPWLSEDTSPFMAAVAHLPLPLSLTDDQALPATCSPLLDLSPPEPKQKAPPRQPHVTRAPTLLQKAPPATLPALIDVDAPSTFSHPSNVGDFLRSPTLGELLVPVSDVPLLSADVPPLTPWAVSFPPSYPPAKPKGHAPIAGGYALPTTRTPTTDVCIQASPPPTPFSLGLPPPPPLGHKGVFTAKDAAGVPYKAPPTTTLDSASLLSLPPSPDVPPPPPADLPTTEPLAELDPFAHFAHM